MESDNSTPPPPENVNVHIEGDVSGQVAIGKNITQKINQFFFGNIEQQHAQRNRQAMLELVRNAWVKGVLEQSLHGEAMIELGMEYDPEAVIRPWDMIVQTDRGRSPVPPSARIVDVFDDTSGALLILGEPGAGKTTMLLELAREAIARAEEDPTQPIPVVFNLSSWAEKRQPIEEWLVEELNTKYHIPKKVAQPWVESDELLLLLDGLDEVKQEHREKCVVAINDFRQEYGLTPLVICSRIADYEALTTRLDLRGAVLLQPLTPQQIEQYLDRAGAELAAAREILHRDSVFQELVKTPLMISVMTLAYQGASIEDLRLGETAEARRTHLFDSYVQRMFGRRRVDHFYSQERVIRWLSWMADKMSCYSQSEILIERLQPVWLQTLAQQIQYTIASVMIDGLVGGLVCGGSSAFVTGVMALVTGRLKPVAFFGLLGAMLGGVTTGLLGVLAVGSKSIEPVELLRWSWQQVVESARMRIRYMIRITKKILGVTALNGLVFWLASVIVGWVVWSLLWSIEDATLVVPVIGGVFGTTGVVSGFITGTVTAALDYGEVETKTIPNQGIRRSARNAVYTGLFSGLLSILAIGPAFRLLLERAWNPVLETSDVALPWLGLQLLAGMIGVPMVMLAVGLRLGGYACLRHLILRFILYHHNCLPWRAVPFLDYCTERIFLRKVGGGYIFVHRLLQDYFASLYEEGAA